MSREVTLGVLSPFLGGWYYGGVIAGISQSAPQVGANVIAIQTCNAGSDQEEVIDPPELRHPLAWDHAAGFIVILRAATPAYLKSIQQTGKPVVMVGHDFDDLDCPVIVPDNISGAREIVAHLIGHGHRRIAFAGFFGANDIVERFEAYCDTLRAHGIEPDPELVFTADDNLQSGGVAAAYRMLDAGITATALVMGTDSNATGLLGVLDAAGVRVPEDLAVVGFDDHRVAAYSQPRLTTVRQPVGMLGRTAVAELMKRIRGETIETGRHYVPTAMILRESCGCSPGTATRPAGMAELTRRLRADISPVPGEVALERIARDVAVIAAAATTGTDAGTQAEFRAAVDRLARSTGRPEILMDMVRTVWAHGQATAAESLARGDIDALGEASAIIESVMLTLMQIHGRAQFDDSSFLLDTMRRDYDVSSHLLRSHREDPRRLDWLERTQARAGSLGLWSTSGRPVGGAAVLDIVGDFARDKRPDIVVPTALGVGRFPPAHLIDLAGEQPDDVVFVVPVKVDSSDWGLLAIVDAAEPQVATGRESVNHWAALLSATLDYEKVLRDLRHRKDQLRTAALYDNLTGLPNRTLFLDRLRRAITSGGRRATDQFAVLFLDLDGFKVVNDSLGHAVGDRLLVQVAGRIAENLRDSDTAARFGGDEFIILLDGVESLQAAVEVAERLQLALVTPFHLENQDVVVSASIGITLSGGVSADAEGLLRDADIAMYSAKSQMKGSYAVFDTAMRTRAVQRLQIETELRHAIEYGGIEVHYQPIVHLATGQIHAFEALARWRHPVRGLIAPNDFLPIAEETGLIVALGQQVLAESCRQLAEWQRATGRDDLRMTVNVSHRQLWTGALIEDITASLQESGLDGGCLALELTESVVMRNVVQARRVLEELHELSCSVYIDDFGTGYSSLEALHRLPIDALKIDRSFVSRLGVDMKSSELVHSIVLMGQKLGLELIAEGVETEVQRAHLLRFDCVYGQGYLFAKPVPADEAQTLLTPEL